MKPEISTFLLMFSLSNTTMQTDFHSIEIEKLIKDNMALVFAKLIILF